MKSNFVNITFILLLFSFMGYAQAPQIQWQKSLGGTSDEDARSMIQTTDGGYIICGLSQSNNGDVSGNHGVYDYWVVKLSTTGTIEWQKSLGGTGQDLGVSIFQTTDGGYIVAGRSFSNNGDVTGNHGSEDYWIVKLSSIGVIEWQKSLGGTSNDTATSIIQTTDGGYIVAGSSSSNNGDVTGNHGGNDVWIVKLSSAGVIEWQKCIGGASYDSGSSIIQTTEGGYIFCGTTQTGVQPGGIPIYDAWIVKLSSTGVIEWQKYLGGTGSDSLSSISETNDGGYITAGATTSNNGDVSGNNGYYDYWVVKLSSTGVIEWQKCLGGTDFDIAASIIQTSDSGYIVAGNTYSINNGDVTGHYGSTDYWIVKLSTTGVIQWQKCLGGSGADYKIGSIIQTTDGGYSICGQSNSINGDVTGNHGDYDYWIVKLSGNLTTSSFSQEAAITLFPNPAKENVFIKLDYFSPSQEITITDIQGKIIHAQKIEGPTTTINTSSFEKGVYLLTLFSDGNKTTQKFIVE